MCRHSLRRGRGHFGPGPGSGHACYRVGSKLPKDWYAKQSCESCHHQILPAIAFRVAREHGLAVNEAIARDNALHAYSPFASLDRAVQYTHIIDPSLDDGYRLLAMDAAGVRPNLSAAVYARFIASRQRPDGHWVTIDQRPPQSYSYITATTVSLRAIQLYGHKALASGTAQRIQRARAWLRSQHARDTEERTFQLLGLRWAGESTKELARYRTATARERYHDSSSALRSLAVAVR